MRNYSHLIVRRVFGMPACVLIGAFVIFAFLENSAESQTRLEGEFGFWKIICETPPGASSEQCAIIQNVRHDSIEDMGLAIMMLRPADRQGDILRVLAPLGVLLPRGLGLEIDDAIIGTAWFVKCFADGCYAEVEIDEKLLEALKTGKTAIFKIFSTPEEGVGFPIELEGFAQAYSKL
ncbi:MAG: invasion associated locus B family protein [Rhizobiaceae bacterium]